MDNLRAIVLIILDIDEIRLISERLASKCSLGE